MRVFFDRVIVLVVVGWRSLWERKQFGSNRGIFCLGSGLSGWGAPVELS